MEATSSDVVKAMSTAVAPVFLISGVAVLLGSMNVRYGRVIDRTRQVLADARQRSGGPRPAEVDAELRTLYGRARVLRLTVILAVATIFSLALCIFLIFTNIIWGVTLPYVIPSLFMVALIFLITSLGFFIEDFATSLSALKSEMRVALGREVSHLESKAKPEKDKPA